MLPVMPTGAVRGHTAPSHFRDSRRQDPQLDGHGCREAGENRVRGSQSRPLAIFLIRLPPR